MSTLQARLSDQKYQNWVKAGICLLYTREGLEDFVASTSQQLHQNVLDNLTKASVPNTGQPVCGITTTRQRLVTVCHHPYCQAFLNAVVQEGVDPNHPFTLKHGNLANSDISLWHSTPYEVTKIFMNPGQKSAQTGPAQTDLSGLVNFIAHCKVPCSKISSLHLIEEVRNARNAIMHTSEFKVTEPDLRTYSQSMINLLNDVNISASPRAQQAVAQIQRVTNAADFTITLEDEGKVITSLAKELHILTVEIKQKLAEVEKGVEKESGEIRRDIIHGEEEMKKVNSLYNTLQQRVDESFDLHDQIGHQLKQVDELLKETIREHTQRLLQVEQQQNQTYKVVDNLQVQQEIYQVQTIASIKCIKAQQEEYHTKTDAAIGNLLNKAGQTWIPSEEDKSRLQYYLMEGYKDKLDVTLLPDWNPLNVSEIFTPSILVDKQMEDSHNLGSYKEIFYESDDLEKRVFLLGEAGTGKTTFSKHLTDVWCETATHPQFSDVAFLKQFHYFFNVSCRFSNKKETILDMINYQLFGDEKMQKVAEYVLKHYPECCLIVLDGADEWIGSPSSETGRRGDIAGLPGMTGVEDCVILITSRPWRFHSLSNKTQNMFRCLNIKGIKDQRELAYRILQQLREPDPEQSSYEFLSQVRDTSMSDLMKIPLILIIALDCWVDDKSFHKSMCINYINMIQLFIRRSEGQAGWSDSESKLRRCIPNLDKLEAKWKKQSNKLPDAFLRYESIQRFAGLFLSIGNIAFDLLLGKTEISLVFSKAALKTYPSVNDESVNVCLALGILSKTNINTCGLKKLESYAYCHKTFQEFFAALWLASNYSNEQSKLFICIKTVRDLHRYEILITFLCGIDSETGKKFWIDLAEKVEMKDMTKNERKLMKTELQKLSCKCMKEQGFDPRDQTSDQICFCIPHIQINQYTSNEDIRLLCHVMEENFCNIKSLFVFDCQSAQQVLRLYRSISSCSGLQSLNLRNLPTVSRQSDSLGSAVLDLQKHNKLEKLKLWGVCVDSLLLPIEGSRITKLCLYCVTVDHHSLELIGESLSSCYVLEYLYLHRVGCFEHNDSCSIPVLDLQTHYQLEQLCLGSLSVEGLLLPLVGARDTSLTLHSVTMSHHGLEQLGESLSSCSCLNNLNLEITCSEHSDSCCFSELDLQKLTKLENMELHSLSYAGLLLPMEGARITSLYLINITIDQHGLEKLQESMASCSSLKKLDLNTVTCSEHSDSYCPIVLDLQKHNKLEELVLWNLILECLLLPVGGARITSLVLGRITMTHHGLEYLETSLSTRFRFYMRLLYEVKCGEHSDSSCLPVLNLPKHNGLKQLGESMSSFFGLKKLGLKDYFFLFYTPPL